MAKAGKKNVVHPPSERISEDNFEAVALRVVARYKELNSLFDYLVWNEIINFYDAKIEKLEIQLSETRALFEAKRKKK